MSGRDIGSIRLAFDTSPEQLQRFIGAVQAANRLGFDVTLRVLNDPYADKAGEILPLDIYAEARLRARGAS